MIHGIRPGDFFVTDDQAQSTGLLAGRYQVGDIIGVGGMADVYAGMDVRLGRRVAIKLLKPSLARDPAFRSRFRREAQDAAKMSHPTIVRIFDAGEETVADPTGPERQVPFIIMEFVEGRVLKEIIAEGPLAPAEAARIIEQVLTALEYSHRAGVIHRDIKPGNIMVTATGQVKVMDFGIARAISESSATIAETSSIVGTAAYFSPEQARGETVDPRTDLYSAGIVLFEMLTGRAPFVDANPVAVAYQHVNELASAPSTLNPAVSPMLDAVVLRAMSKDRFSRYQAASEFRHDVAAVVAGNTPTLMLGSHNDFTTTLFGVDPSSTAGSEATIRQLTAHETDNAVQTQNRPPVAWIWGGIVVMIALVVAVGFWTANLSSTPLTTNVAVDVPDVVGFNWENGSTTLTSANLEPNRVDETSESVAVGTIVRTDPAAGITVAPGQIVKVYVSSGAAQVRVPQIINMTQAEATAALEAVGLRLGAVSTTYSSTVAATVVLLSTPNSGEFLAFGSTVDITVSNGLVQVPDTVGKSVGEATSTLSALQLRVKSVGDITCAGALVVSQSVTGDAPARSEVTITYCAAP
jgi:serine/threonine-protein kinase